MTLEERLAELQELTVKVETTNNELLDTELEITAAQGANDGPSYHAGVQKLNTLSADAKRLSFKYERLQVEFDQLTRLETVKALQTLVYGIPDVKLLSGEDALNFLEGSSPLEQAFEREPEGRGRILATEADVAQRMSDTSTNRANAIQNLEHAGYDISWLDEVPD